MKINLNEILKIQDQLDNYIESNHQLNKADLLSRKKLALIVELAELCNEVRSFKFWSLKASSPKKIILDEFVDCLHFILSIGLFYQLESFDYEIKIKAQKDKLALSNFFMDLISEVKDLDSQKKVISFMLQLFELAYDLGLTFDEIVNAYLEKNKVNYQRQIENY
ncbi:MAG: dUTP diphosphatase [Mycoplasmoidaceae bacterium]